MPCGTDRKFEVSKVIACALWVNVAIIDECNLKCHCYILLKVNWSNDIINKMNAQELAKDVTEAENMLQMHHERKVRVIFILCLIHLHI